MNFLNGALLAGAAALAIPIIIHLFHKSRFEVVRWGAMHLLETVVRTNQRRVRLEQLILLIIRAAIPVLLALAMARPIWKGGNALLGDAKTSTVVVLDSSYSMEAARGGRSNFDIAREAGSRIVNDLRRGSDVQVILAGETGTPLFDSPTFDTVRAAKTVSELNAGFGAATIPDALNAAAGAFGQMHEVSRNLVFVTDFQRVSFPPQGDAALSEAVERLRALPIVPSITFFDAGTEVRDNVAVDSLEFSRLMIGVGQNIQIRANLRNYGGADYPDLRVYLRADGREKTVSQIALGPNEAGQVLFTHAFDTPGSHTIEVYADADPLKADNSYLASIPVRDQVPVLLVNGDPNREPLKGETDFAEIALQPYSAGRVEMADLIRTKVVTTEELKAGAMSESSVVVLANVRKLNDEQVRGLQEYVKNGGGVLIFPGNRTDSQWWNATFAKDGNGLLPARFGALSGDVREGSRGTSIVSQRFANPALELFNDARNGSLAEAEIKLWFKLDPLPAAEGATPPSILAVLDSGEPFLMERQFGEGRVILASTAIDSDWSNLPLRPFYLPLLQRLSVYLASNVYPPRNLEVGRELVAFVRAEDAAKTAALTRPDGITENLLIEKRGGRGVVEYAKTQRPGLYTLLPPDGQPIHYVVNASRRESDLTKLTPDEIETLGKNLDVRVVRSGEEYQNIEQTLRYGQELWKPVLWILLGLCFGELIVQRMFSQARGRV
jgi:hypothetical protein